MKPEAQRIAIAEAVPAVVEWHDGLPFWRGMWSSVGEGNEHFALFDPLNDLNAMHKAEGALTRDLWNAYLNWVHVVSVTAEIQPEADFQWVHATAAQRAEAFLLTLGKWVD